MTARRPPPSLPPPPVVVTPRLPTRLDTVTICVPESESNHFQIIERMMSGLGDEIDPAMMSALMATTALVAAGASNEEVSRDGSLSHCKFLMTFD